MSSKHILYLAASACCALGTPSFAADTVIGNWENATDGWMDWGTGLPISATKYTYSTIGVTLGSSSLKLVPGAGWEQSLALKLQDFGFVDDFLANTQFSIDVTWDSSDWAGPGTWAKIEDFVVNSEGGSWHGYGVPDIDTGNPGYPGGWDPTNYPGLHTRTMTWDYSDLVDGNPDNGEVTRGDGHPYWVEFVLTTNFDPAFTSAAYYFDNARLSTVAINAAWTGADSDAWSGIGNWAGGVPSGVDHIANFGSIDSGRYSVNVDSPRTVGVINFDTESSYTLAGSAITMEASAGDPRINVYSGHHTIASPLTLNNWLFIEVVLGASLDITGAVTVTPGGRAIRKNGAGVAQLLQLSTGDITINSGTLRISEKATPNSDAGTTLTETMTIAPGAALDLTNNSMIIDYAGAVGTLVDDVRQHLQTGRLTSSSADATKGLGYGDNAILRKSSFAGQTVDADSLLIKYTYFGDTNLDGQVDITDLGNLATAWQTSGAWTSGDSDYSGFIDITDLGLLATNWQAGVGSPLGPSFNDALAAVGLGNISIPEPTMLGVLVGGCVAGLGRRRRM